jgi:hypothetical protein
VSSAKPKLITLEQFAAERRIRVGRMLFLKKESGFPRPVLRHGRDDFYDPADIRRFFTEAHPRWSLTKCLASKS